jgi:hypothetical protein
VLPQPRLSPQIKKTKKTKQNPKTKKPQIPPKKNLKSKNQQPNDEKARVKALRHMLLLDTKPNDTLDGITTTMSEVFKVPVVLVSLAGLVPLGVGTTFHVTLFCNRQHI